MLSLEEPQTAIRQTLDVMMNNVFKVTQSQSNNLCKLSNEIAFSQRASKINICQTSVDKAVYFLFVLRHQRSHILALIPLIQLTLTQQKWLIVHLNLREILP